MRLYLTNTANTRVFNVALPGARMKLVGGDSGRVEREEFVDDVVLAPSERVVVDVLFEQPGELTLEHRTPDRTYQLAAITSTTSAADAAARRSSSRPAHQPRAGRRARADRAVSSSAEPDKTLAFVAEMDMGEPDATGPVVYACPMHPEVVSEEPDQCPQCGMKLMRGRRRRRPPTSARCTPR